MNQQLVDRIRLCQNLPSLPSIAVQVLDLAQRPDVGIAEIAQVISRDPALSGKILRTVNSSFYGRSQTISTISHAVTILGLQSVKTLVLGFSLVSNLSTKKSRGFKHLHYWKRSVFAATAARMVGAKIDLVQQEELFIAALLSDIGMLVLDRVLGDEYGELCSRHETHPELLAAEVEKLHMTHAEVGGMLAAEWKLPPVLATPIRRHHDPDAVNDPPLRRLTEVVGLAGRIADVFVDANAAPAIAQVRQAMLGRYQIPGVECDLLLGEINLRTREVASLFEINIGSAENFETILKKANDALVEMTLRSQHQASQLQQQASQLEKKAGTLQELNTVLKKVATVDALTGLANRARFDAFLTEHFAAGVATRRPLALLMVDIDRFKGVNDKHGHPAGDAVLKALGRLLSGSTRPGDMAARYGGEEMALVLPNTTRNDAASIAEALRRAIAQESIHVPSGASLSITASIGVAAMEPATGPVPFREPAHLVKAADLALYAAKSAGRNCVRVFALNKPGGQAQGAGGTGNPPASAQPTAA
jgi:diguanylate cyclase (GGDEF)-like protein